MKLGFVSAILPDSSLEDVITFAGAEGFRCIEPMCWPRGGAERRYAGVTHIDAEGFDAASARHVLDLIEAAGIEISALGYYPNPLSPDREEAEVADLHLRRVIEAARLLGLTQVNTFIGRDWKKTVDENWPRFLEVWKPLVRFAESQGVRIGIENCPMLFGPDEWPGGKNLATTPAIWRRMFEAIPSASFGLNYDPSHLIWQRIDPIQPLFEFADRIFHVHAKDVRLDRRRLDDVGILAYPHQYHHPKLPGLGDLNWGHFLAVLGEIGYSGPVCIEVEDRAYEGSLELRKESLRQSARFLRTVMPA
jgi:sugar phosphate isomerase/epimerase